MKLLRNTDSNSYLGDLSALVQHELQNPLSNLQGVIRLLSTGRFGKLSQEGSQLLHTAMTNLDRLTRLAIAVGEQPTSLSSVLSPEQIRILQLQHDLPTAISEKQFYLVYQPIICSVTDTVIGFEALARWSHPTFGSISPTVFIPLAEESGLIHQIGKQLIEDACRQLSHWQHIFPSRKPLTVSVNLSVLQLYQLDLVDHIEQILEVTQIKPQSLKLEITESALIENSEIVSTVLQKLINLGIQLYLDDFGTGYSALSRLPFLPLDSLKIDRTFVANKNWEICEVILSLANKLDLKVIVEGVETSGECTKIKSLGFQYIQGYFFSHPLKAEEISPFLMSFESRDILSQWLQREMALAS